ncbi:hypothetical protein GGS21DRAFT_165327 [Xylaria nigripes]|nr:hypothetical protein GGS21DRAFT_165327 [Xylaria nigripes]
MSSVESRKQQQGRALEAAHWLFETQKMQLAQDPNRPRSSISSTRDAARKFSVSKSNVARQLAALKAGKTSAGTGNKVGRPNRLTDVEEQMLSFHTFMLRREMRPVSMKVVKEAADALLSRRNSPGAPVSSSWVRRWLRADRALARQGASRGAVGGGVGELQSAELAGADIDDDEDDDNDDDEEADDKLGEDLSSESEIADASLYDLEPNATAGDSIESTTKDLPETGPL